MVGKHWFGATPASRQQPSASDPERRTRGAGFDTGLCRRTAFVGTLAGLAAPALVGSASAQSRHRWRIQGYLPAGFDIHEEFVAFCRALGEKSGGALAVEAVPVGAVVAVTETLDAMRTGLLTGHLSGPPYFTAKDAAFAVLGDTSAAYDEVDQRDRFWSEGGGLDLMRRLYAQHGAYCVAPVFSLAEWLVSKMPLEGVASLRGVKVRAPQGIVADLFRHFGAGVVVLPGTEVFTALSTGVIDAADWGWLALNERTGLHRVARYAIYVPHSMGVTDFSVAAREWDRLSADLKVLVEREVNLFSQRLRQRLTAEEKEAERRLSEQGVVLMRWPESERRILREAVFKIWERLAASSSAARAAVEAHRAFIKRLGLPL